MAYSVFQDPQGVDWPLGYINVPTSGTPVNIMYNVDPNNKNAPTSYPAAEYTPRCHKIFFQAYKPAANNAGMIPTSGNVYVCRSLGPNNQNAGGNANRTDPGAMVFVIPPGGFATLPADEVDHATISPYRYTIDVDNNNDGCLVTLVGSGR